MISYKDMTFCSATCVNFQCERNYNHAINGQASIPEEKRLPVALSNLKDTDMCPGYQSFAEQIGIDDPEGTPFFN